MSTVLIIDDNPAVARALELLLSLHDLDVLHASTPQEGLDLLRGGAIDLVIQDMNFSADTTSGQEGEALFRDIRNEYPDLPVILLTAWTQLDTAVSLVKAGAADYLAKPWDDQRLLATVKNLLEFGEANRAMAHETRQRKRARDLAIRPRYPRSDLGGSCDRGGLATGRAGREVGRVRVDLGCERCR